MELAKSGKIGGICTPNALATFKEYLLDFSTNGESKESEEALNRLVNDLPEKTKNSTKRMIEKLESGDRDVFF
jgi:2-iminoacetate synthase